MKNTTAKNRRISTRMFSMTAVFAMMTIAFFVTGYTGAGVVYLPGTLLFALAAFIVRRYENKKQNDTQR